MRYHDTVSTQLQFDIPSIGEVQSLVSREGLTVQREFIHRYLYNLKRHCMVCLHGDAMRYHHTVFTLVQ